MSAWTKEQTAAYQEIVGRVIPHPPRPWKGGFDKDIADHLCREMANGFSVNKLTAQPGMPSFGTICRWEHLYPAFSEDYARARIALGDYYANDIVDVADGEDDPHRARVRIDARKWAAAQMAPKKYSERRILQGDPESPITVGVRQLVIPDDASTEELMAIERLLRVTVQAQIEDARTIEGSAEEDNP